MSWILPEGWSEVPLGKLLVDGPTNGYSPTASEDAKGTWSFKLSATTSGRFIIDDRTKKRLDETIPASAKYWLKPGDLLVQRSNTLEYVGTAAIYEGPADSYIYPDTMMRLRLSEPDTTRWLWRYLNGPSGREYFRKVAGGAASSMSKISGAKLQELTVPLPPLPEQKRIAAILDKADEIRRKRAEAIKLTEELLKSAFLEMFGDPVTNPKGWPVRKLGDGIAQIDAGWSVGGDARLPRDGEDAVLKISAVTSGWFLADECKSVPSHDRNVPRPRRGDLLFSRANTRELVAATCLVEEDAPRRFLPDKLWRISTTADLRVEYLRYVLSFEGIRHGLTSRATGTSGSMLNISQAKLTGFDLPLPSREKQSEFAQVVWKIYDRRRKLLQQGDAEQFLTESLTQRAFRGEL